MKVTELITLEAKIGFFFLMAFFGFFLMAYFLFEAGCVWLEIVREVIDE